MNATEHNSSGSTPARTSARLLTAAVVLLAVVALLQAGLMIQRHLSRPRPLPAPPLTREWPPPFPEASDPFEAMRQIQRHVNGVFADLDRERDQLLAEIGERITPEFRVHERDTAYELVVQLPGVEKSDIHITMENSVLGLLVTRKQEATDAASAGSRSGRVLQSSFGRYERHLRLPGATSHPEEIQARFSDHVLKITVPKAPPKDTPASPIAIH